MQGTPAEVTKNVTFPNRPEALDFWPQYRSIIIQIINYEEAVFAYINFDLQ